MDNHPVRGSPSISAVLADVDGTLVTKDKVLTQRALQAVRQMRERRIAALANG